VTIEDSAREREPVVRHLIGWVVSLVVMNGGSERRGAIHTGEQAGEDAGGRPTMLTLLVFASGATVTPLIRFMLAGFECLSIGAIVLRITDAIRRPRLADLAAQRRERWEAVHPAVPGDATDPDDD
jgi:hypothetical protein